VTDLTDLIDQLEYAIQSYIQAALPNGHRGAQQLPDLLTEYRTWRKRFIAARPRRCHLSRELRSSPKFTEHQAALSAIVEKIAAGADLGPHLSKAAETDSGRDRMLADFGVYHLHVSTSMEPSGRYVTRGKDLLFAAFKPDDAYLIGIYEHITDWACESTLATVARNWPDAGIVHELRSVDGLERQYSDPDRLALQKAGVSVGAIEVDGKVFSTIGQSIGGAPYEAQQFRMTVMEVMRDWRENLADRLAEATIAVNNAAGREITGDWTPVVHEGIAGLQREEVFHRIVSLAS
jgi:hypothetical protein